MQPKMVAPGGEAIVEIGAVHTKEQDALAASRLRLLFLDRNNVRCSPVTRAVLRLLDGDLNVPFLSNLTVDAALTHARLSDGGDDADALDRTAEAAGVSAAYARNCYARLLTTHLRLANGSLVWGSRMQYVRTTGTGKHNVTIEYANGWLRATAVCNIAEGAPLWCVGPPSSEVG